MLEISLVLVVITSIFMSTNDVGDKIQSVFNTKKELPIYYVDTDEKKIAISFDAAWGTDHTKEILDILDKYDVKTTFFLVDFWASKYPDMVKEIDKRGHEVQNHSTTHPKLTEMSKEEIIKEVKTTEETIEKIIDKKPTLFRLPFGDYNDEVIRTLREIDYHVIQWDVDSLDWKEEGVEPVIDKVTRNVKKGSVVLFHNNAKYVRDYLPAIIEKLQDENYEIVPVSELIHKDDYHMDGTGKQIKSKDKTKIK